MFTRRIKSTSTCRVPKYRCMDDSSRKFTSVCWIYLGVNSETIEIKLLWYQIHSWNLNIKWILVKWVSNRMSSQCDCCDMSTILLVLWMTFPPFFFFFFFFDYHNCYYHHQNVIIFRTSFSRQSLVFTSPCVFAILANTNMFIPDIKIIIVHCCLSQICFSVSKLKNDKTKEFPP